MSRWKAMLSATLPLMVLLGMALLLDLDSAVSTNRWFVAAVAVPAVLLAGAVAALSRRPECLLLLLPFAAALALLASIDISPVKPFARFYAVIEPGMTETEVIAALDAQFSPLGRHPRPSINRRLGPNHLGFILNPKDGRYDAEIVSLDLEAGRVTAKRYYPD